MHQACASYVVKNSFYIIFSYFIVCIMWSNIFLNVLIPFMVCLKEKQNVWILSYSLRVQSCWTYILHLDKVVFNLAKSPTKAKHILLKTQVSSRATHCFSYMKTSSTFKQVWATFSAAHYLLRSVEKGTKVCGWLAWWPSQSKRVQGKEIIDTGKNNREIYPGSLKHLATKIIQHTLQFSLKI